MATEYPTALDSWPVIEANTQENAVDKYHDVVHVNVHDALAAVQAKLGIDASADDTSIDNRLAVVETSADLNASDIEDINTALTGAYFVPSGGTTAQILAKASDTDGDTEWIDAPSGGSGGGSSPTTTKGDLIVRGTSADGRLPVGTDGQIPYADSGETLGIRWGDAPSGGGSATEITPASLVTSYGADNGSHYAIHDISTMWQDTAGTVPAVVDSPVLRIDDQSGLGNNATQATSGSAPILRQTDGMYWLETTGGKYLDCGSAFDADEFTAVVIYQASNTNCRLIDCRGTGAFGSVTGWYFKGRNPGQDLLGVDDGSGHYISVYDPGTGTDIHMLAARYLPNRLGWVQDMRDETISTGSSIGSITGSVTSRIGAASNSAGTQTLSGGIYQIVVLNKRVALADLRALQDYCSRKSGF